MKRVIILTISFAALMTAAVTTTQAQEGIGKFAATMEKVKSSLDPAAVAGLHTYEPEDVYKALKVRRSGRQAEISSILRDYNAGVGSLRSDNLDLIAGLGIAVKDIINEKDFKNLWNARSDYKHDLVKVRTEQAAMHSTLEEQLEEVLTRRQERKWRKLQERLEKEQAATFDMGDLFSFVGF